MGILRWLRKTLASVEEEEVLRAVDAVRASTIAGFTEGTIGKIAGTVHELDKTLVSPLGQRRCVWWSVTVTGGPYRSVTRDGRPFVVADDSGRATIKPFDARTVISTDSVHKCRGIRPEPVHEPFLRELDRLDGTYRNGREPTRPYRFRFEEAVIVAGARLMVTGLGMRELEVHDQTDYRSAAARLLITGTVDHPVHLIDEL